MPTEWKKREKKMNNEKKTEIRIYTNIKDDMEFIIKQIENHNIDIIKIFYEKV